MHLPTFRSLLAYVPLLLGIATGCSASDLAPGEDALAVSIIDRLREQFRIPEVDPLTGETRWVPFLKPSYIIATSIGGERPTFGIDPKAGAVSADFELPDMSNARTSIGRRGRARSLSFAPSEAMPVGAKLGRGYLLFPSGHPQGGHMIRGATAEGLEDYVVFGRRPPAESLRYQLELGSDVAGLRRIGNALEALDAQGRTQLRITEPTLVDSKGQVVAANLDVEGCVADTEPSVSAERPVLPPYSRSCAVVVSWNGAALEYPVLVDPTWASAGSMAFARANFTLSWLPSGYALAIGGAGSDGKSVPVTELYDPSNNLWSLRQPLHYPRSKHTATTLWNGKVLVTGGLLDGNVPTARAELVDIGSAIWDDVKDIPGPARYSHTATPLPNGNVFVVGGQSGTASSTALADAFIYVSAIESWLPAPIRTARYGHSATPLSDGNVLVVGGLNGAGAIKSADLYLSTSNAWIAAGNLNVTGRAFHTATLMRDGKVLIAGGGVTSAIGFIPISNVDLYEAGAWKAGPPMNVARAYATANLLPDGKVLVVGGYSVVNGTIALVASNEVYDPSVQKWTLIESTASVHAFHASVSIPNSNAAKNAVANPAVVIAGGYSSSTSVTRSAELITTASCTGWMSPGDGSGGVFAPSVGTVLPSGLYQFAAIDIPSGVRVTASGSGVLDLRAATTASVSGTLDVSGSRGGSGHTVPAYNKGGNGGGGATGNPDSPGFTGDTNTCYNGVALGGDGYAGSGQGEHGSRCGNGGGKNGGGVGGACDGAWENQKPGSGAGGGGYAGGGGGSTYDYNNQNEGGRGGGTYGGESRKGGSGPPGYNGGDGQSTASYGGGGGAIGADAASDLAALTTFRTGSGGGGGAANGDENASKYGGGGGGGGGGVVRIVSAGLLRVPSTGSVLAKGGDGGYAGQQELSGGGGGGSGGLIVLVGNTLSALGTIRAEGGAGGLAGTTPTGGAGGMGRIVLSAASQAGCSIGSAITPAPLSGCTASTGSSCNGKAEEPACGKAYVMIGTSVCAGLAITPIALSAPYTNLSYAASVTLSASGGSGLGYSYAMVTSNTGGSVVASTGMYTAGSKQGTDTVEVKDSLGNKATLTLTVFPLSATGSSSFVVPRGTLSFSAAGGQGTYSWTVSPNRSGATINPTTGSYVAGRTGGVTDTVVVTDSLGGSAGFDVTVLPAITLTPASASVTPKGTQTFTAAGGSTTGYTWTVPTYPSGGSHASSSSGAYKAGNTGGVTDVLRVTDSLGNIAEARVTVGPSVTITTPTVNLNTGGTVRLSATGGTGAGYTWTLLSRPSGGSINATTGDYTAGLIAAVSDVAQVTDSLGATGTATLHIAKPIIISPASLDAFKPQDQRTFTATGGSGVGFTWTVTGGSGATIGATTGVYKAGRTGYTQDTVQVTDSFGNVATAVVNVGAGVSIGPSIASLTQKGSVPFTATGGTGGPYTWLAPSEGHGTVSTTGVYTAGTDCLYSESVTVRDSLMNTASATVQVGTCFAIVASTTTVPASTGTLTLSTIGGTGTGVSWSLATGGSGGKIDPTTGIYTAGPTRNSKDTVTAKDSLSNTATLTIQVY